MAEMTGDNGNVRNDYLTRFRADFQPSFEGRIKGWMKRRKGKELVRLILEQDYQANEEIKAEAARLFGVEPEEITNEVMMIFCQIHNSINNKDTAAFANLMDRAYGKPKEVPESPAINNPTFSIQISHGNSTGDAVPPIAESEDEIGAIGGEANQLQ
jgi:hypothetical protein